MSSKEKKILEEILEPTGIKFNGDKPYDIQVHNDKFYKRVLVDGSLGFGESYMDGWWDCKALDQLIDRIFRAEIDEKVKGNWKIIWHVLRSKLFNLQKPSRSYKVGEEHYDLGNDLYTAMLDKRLNYTCGYWSDADNLDDAQEAKLDLVCRKIELQPGMTVLDIGCGFGCFAGYAAEKYGAKVTGVTVSKKQAELGMERFKHLPVELKLEDYRKLTGKYDRVISIGIMEHIGFKNYRTYMEVVDRTLKEDGIAFIHTIGGNESVTTSNPWLMKYIFPNSMLPSIAQISKAMEGLFVIEDLHNIGPDYEKTLLAWYDNFEKAWPDLEEKYGERFYRMWKFYLLSCAGTFRSRSNQLWQIVMTKPGRTQPDCRLI
ncbi:cyclopropane fatty acyl phospholipid synthase [bacterium]|nr:cyclopropane fatty acyl phospholipid synthase [bacterium]